MTFTQLIRHQDDDAITQPMPSVSLTFSDANQLSNSSSLKDDAFLINNSATLSHSGRVAFLNNATINPFEYASLESQSRSMLPNSASIDAVLESKSNIKAGMKSTSQNIPYEYKSPRHTSNVSDQALINEQNVKLANAKTVQIPVLHQNISPRKLTNTVTETLNSSLDKKKVATGPNNKKYSHIKSSYSQSKDLPIKSPIKELTVISPNVKSSRSVGKNLVPQSKSPRNVVKVPYHGSPTSLSETFHLSKSSNQIKKPNIKDIQSNPRQQSNYITNTKTPASNVIMSRTTPSSSNYDIANDSIQKPTNTNSTIPLGTKPFIHVSNQSDNSYMFDQRLPQPQNPTRIKNDEISTSTHINPVNKLNMNLPNSVASRSSTPSQRTERVSLKDLLESDETHRKLMASVMKTNNNNNIDNDVALSLNDITIKDSRINTNNENEPALVAPNVAAAINKLAQSLPGAGSASFYHTNSRSGTPSRRGESILTSLLQSDEEVAKTAAPVIKASYSNSARFDDEFSVIESSVREQKPAIRVAIDRLSLSLPNAAPTTGYNHRVNVDSPERRPSNGVHGVSSLHNLLETEDAINKTSTMKRIDSDSAAKLSDEFSTAVLSNGHNYEQELAPSLEPTRLSNGFITNTQNYESHRLVSNRNSINSNNEIQVEDIVSSSNNTAYYSKSNVAIANESACLKKLNSPKRDNWSNLVTNNITSNENEYNAHNIITHSNATNDGSQAKQVSKGIAEVGENLPPTASRQYSQLKTANALIHHNESLNIPNEPFTTNDEADLKKRLVIAKERISFLENKFIINGIPLPVSLTTTNGNSSIYKPSYPLMIQSDISEHNEPSTIISDNKKFLEFMNQRKNKSVSDNNMTEEEIQEAKLVAMLTSQIKQSKMRISYLENKFRRASFGIPHG